MSFASFLSRLSSPPVSASAKAHVQHAALPYVETGRGIEVCLITSRETGRWVVPKGWPKPGVEPCDLARLEAFEEAGLEGTVSRRPIGTYHYDKRLHYFFSVPCMVDVYALRVERHLLDWPEKAWRTLRWMPPLEAAQRVDEKELASIIAGFAGDSSLDAA